MKTASMGPTGSRKIGPNCRWRSSMCSWNRFHDPVASCVIFRKYFVNVCESSLADGMSLYDKYFLTGSLEASVLEWRQNPFVQRWRYGRAVRRAFRWSIVPASPTIPDDWFQKWGWFRVHYMLEIDDKLNYYLLFSCNASGVKWFKCAAKRIFVAS